MPTCKYLGPLDNYLTCVGPSLLIFKIKDKLDGLQYPFSLEFGR